MGFSNNSRWKVIFYLSILSGILLMTAMISVFNRSDYTTFFNSDTLYFPSFYHSLFIEKIGLEGWHTGPSPHFFPDNILYFLLMFITEDLRISSFLFPVIQFIGIMFLVNWLFRIIEIKNAALFASLAGLLLSMHFYVSLASKDLTFGYYLISNAFHVGAFVLALISLCLSLLYLKERKFKHLVIIFLIGLAGIISDKLYIILYVLPMLSLIIVVRKFHSPSSYLILMGVNILTVVLGITGINLIKSAYVVWIGEPHRIMDWANIPASWDMLTFQFGIYMSEFSFKSIIIYLSIIALLASIVFVIVHLTRHKKIDTVSIYLYFSVFFSLGVFIAPVANGNYTGFDTLRYIITVFFLLLINVPVIISLINYKPQQIILISKWFVIIALAVSFVYAGLRFSAKGFSYYLNFYPDTVESLDKIATENGLTRGAGDFWMANYCTAFSKTGLKVYPVHEDMVPYHHLINHKGFYNEDVVFDFFILNNYSNKEAYTKRTGLKGELTEYNDIQVIMLPPYRFDQLSLIPFLINSPDTTATN